MDHFEMGGYLPIELHKGRSYFSDIPDEEILAVNTGRTALWCAIESLQVKKVLVPYYYCPDIIDMLSSLDIELEFYRIGEDFLPRDVYNAPESAIVLVNYFGVLKDELLKLAESLDKVIFDNAHAFYAPPVLREGVMNVYSCRKFFGVSDGAYVIGRNLHKPELEQDISSYRAAHLLISMECGTNAAYSENKQNEQLIGQHRLRMSVLTEKILEGTDYDTVAKRRNENFCFLHEMLKDLQLLPLSHTDVVPYAYPLLLKRDIHKKLIQNKVYVPILWSQLLEEKWTGTIENNYSANIIPLPLDQRYSIENLKKMVGIVKNCIDCGEVE